MSDSSAVLNAPAPPLELPDQDGHPVVLASLLAKGPVVVFFYPKDGTPGCTKEACAFRDAYDTFVAAGCSVLGVSQDSGQDHAEFRGKHQLKFPLLTDAKGAAAKAWGVKKALGLMPGRATFVVDRNGVIVHHFVSMFGVDKHVTQALEVVKNLR